MPRCLIAALVVLAGCSVPTIAPDATQATSARFSSAVPQANARLDIDWWSRIGDARLTELLLLAQSGSPDLRSAAAQVMAARARAGQDTAAMWPVMTGQASVTEADSDTTARTRTRAAGLDASWEVDLFGRASKTAKAERLRAKAEDYAYAGAYVSLSAEVADTYVQLRACRMIEQVYRDAVSSQGETIEATTRLVSAGLRAESDLALARASRASAQISLDSQVADCRVLAQTLAVLTGSPQDRVDAILASGFGMPAVKGFRAADVPADMLRQRPDIAKAELTFAAALLDLGVAKADLYPSLTLGGSVSLAKPAGWSFGPALSLPVLDGGQRRAAVRSANADAITAAEAYRSAVLAAVAEAEAALTRLNAALRNLGSAGTLVKEYDAYFAAIDADWRAGRISLLDREDARRQVQSARITQISQQLALSRQWIALYKAMGGGWQRPAHTVTTTSEG
ncbi:efflux transporter outer membrane subunit [Fuscovulum blasticum]|uniref:efflux transporter outer membrane subunit n=1 Tax=Fuscovulum blasticum TaxID=1075 RepID=UPI000F4FEF87|nr:efflux transporter outer membrane subunit [Fuscovulum blasticum]